MIREEKNKSVIATATIELICVLAIFYFNYVHFDQIKKYDLKEFRNFKNKSNTYSAQWRYALVYENEEDILNARNLFYACGTVLFLIIWLFIGINPVFSSILVTFMINDDKITKFIKSEIIIPGLSQNNFLSLFIIPISILSLCLKTNSTIFDLPMIYVQLIIYGICIIALKYVHHFYAIPYASLIYCLISKALWISPKDKNKPISYLINLGILILSTLFSITIPQIMNKLLKGYDEIEYCYIFTSDKTFNLQDLFMYIIVFWLPYSELYPITFLHFVTYFIPYENTGDVAIKENEYNAYKTLIFTFGYAVVIKSFLRSHIKRIGIFSIDIMMLTLCVIPGIIWYLWSYEIQQKYNAVNG